MVSRVTRCVPVRRLAAWVGALALATGTMACNLVTGADDVEFHDDDDGRTSSAGQGGAAGATTGVTVASGAGAGSAVGSSSVVASTGGTVCQWPAGPYGVGQGQTLPQYLQWQALPPGSDTPTTVSIEEFFDCDGSKGIDAVLFDTAQFG